jgi:FKBP-type peptidyl-prolyl cis-trans isomerase
MLYLFYILQKRIFMKRTILFVSMATIAGQSLQIHAQEEAQAKPTTQTKAASYGQVIQVKNPETATSSMTPGDILNLSEFTSMPSGIKYKIIKKGSGDKAVKGEIVTVHYTGWLLVDGKKVGLKFDSSFDRHQPFSFKLGSNQVIPGWEISLADMKVGETRIVVLPSKQAYGSRATASIPADSTLIFEINVIKAS